jgi:hypothetical protein
MRYEEYLENEMLNPENRASGEVVMVAEKRKG